jgi:hypothetical protein
MRSQMVLCRSQRCRARCFASDDVATTTETVSCPCRYKFKICLSSGTCEVFQQGEHVMHRNDPPTPKELKISPAMKTFIIEKLSSGAKTTATKLFTALSAMVEAREIAGPAPKYTQVTDFVKNWRRENPRDSMAPMIQLCDGNLYDQLDLESLPD